MTYKGLWLAEQDGNNIKLSDGPHTSPAGVAEAKKLIDAIFGDRGRNYVMVKVSDLPKVDVKINEEAAATCKMMIDKAKKKD